MMRILAVGLNHRSAPVEVRERVAFTREELEEALPRLLRRCGPGVILSTCNRTEVYVAAEDLEATAERVQAFVCEGRGVSEEELAPYLYTLPHQDAVQHLFRVASGVDSMILGESQVLGQVRDAYSMAVAAGVANGPISRLFHMALRVGKRARRETGIGRNALSVSYAAVNLAREALGGLRGREVMVVGLGEAGKLVARALENHGVGPVWVTNRTYATAQSLARDLGGQALPFDRLREALERVDIVVSTTGAPEPVITREMMETVLARRRNGPLCLVDIAVPRDVDPSVKGLDGIHLFDIDDLERVSESNRQERQREAEKVEALVREETQKFLSWWETLKVVPTIAAIRRRAEAVRQGEVERTLSRLTSLSEEDRERIEAMSRALVKKLLHDPILTLRTEQGTEYVQAVRHLFRLGD